MLVGWPPSAGPSVIVTDADLWSVSAQKNLPTSAFTKPNSSSKPNARLLTFGKGRKFQTLAGSTESLIQPVVDSDKVEMHSFSHLSETKHRCRHLLSVTVSVEVT